MSSPTKRRDMDICKLMMSEFEVAMNDDNDARFTVKFKGPKESPYEGGTWKVFVNLPKNYPFKSPSIGFGNCIFHPNIDEASGSVCLDVINQTWSPMFDLVNIFSTFLPQLLLYPNASDPLNGEAAALYMQSKEEYEKRVAEYVKKFASADIKVCDADSDDDSSDNSGDESRDIDDEEDEHFSDMDDDDDLDDMDM